MAGDWIKFRGELETHPKLLAMANELIFGDGYGMLLYACGPDALGIGVLPPRNESVTERALRCVTECALRDVTLCALLRVWCAVNAHCKVDGMDAVMSPMSLADIDPIAGFQGFGNAMENAGWVVDDAERNSLRFPNFLDWNEPMSVRPEAKSNAQRQREWRERRAANGATRKSGVTRRNARNDREEKRRDISPNGDIPLPPCLENDEFRAAWSEWRQHRKELKKPFGPCAQSRALKQLDAMGSARAVAAIQHSIAKGWTGIFEPTQEKSHGTLFDNPARVPPVSNRPSRYWKPPAADGPGGPPPAEAAPPPTGTG